MVRLVTFLVFLILPLGVSAQTLADSPASATAPPSSDNGLLQEQAAICASYARLMEYAGLLEKTQGELWRERRFFAGAMLRSTITNATTVEPSNTDIDRIITEYSAWMIDLFTANAVQNDQEKLNDKDKLKDYVETFCTGLFDNADKAIAQLQPDLFINKTQSLVSEDQTNKLLQENIKLQQTLEQLESQVTAQDKALKMANARAENAEQMLKDQRRAMEADQQQSASAQKNAIDTKLAETLPSPPQKPPLPQNLAAEDGDVIATTPTLAPEDVGLTQVQLASYLTIENAEKGLNILSKEMPRDIDVSLQIRAARLASGKNVFRVVSSAVPIETAKMICTHYWAKQYGCIIKMTNKS